MRRLLLPITTLSLAAVLVVSAFGGRAAAVAAAPAVDADLRSTVSVVGDGRVLVQPDIANVSLGVEATGPSFSAAQGDVATRMQAVIDTLVGLGISRDDIKTSRLSAGPVYDPKDNTVIRGYRANSSVQVTIRDLDRVGAIVDAVTANGANRVEGVSFAVEQLEGPKGQARALAMQNARAKADQLASLAGMRVTGVKAIAESDATSTPFRAQPMMAAPAPAAAAAPPVEPGTQEVRTQVTVVYIMEP